MAKLSQFVRDPFSSISHIIAASLAVFATVLLVLQAISSHDTGKIISYIVFGISMISLYSASALYHFITAPPGLIKVLRRIDHLMINILIAGTYTPFCVVALPSVWGTLMLAVVWSLALIGILIAIFWIEAPRRLTTAIYIAMGWVAVTAIYPLVKALPLGSSLYLLAGGLIYTFGAVIYALKKPNFSPKHFDFHDLWHLFVIGGTICHFFSIYLYFPSL